MKDFRVIAVLGVVLVAFPSLMGYAYAEAKDQSTLPPVEALIQMDKALAANINQLDEMKNLAARDATIHALEEKYRLAKLRVEAWKTPFIYQAQTLALDPKFTSINQLSPEMLMALADNPLMMEWLEMRAKANFENSKGHQ